MVSAEVAYCSCCVSKGDGACKPGGKFGLFLSRYLARQRVPRTFWAVRACQGHAIPRHSTMWKNRSQNAAHQVIRIDLGVRVFQISLDAVTFYRVGE